MAKHLWPLSAKASRGWIKNGFHDVSHGKLHDKSAHIETTNSGPLGLEKFERGKGEEGKKPLGIHLGRSFTEDVVASVVVEKEKRC